MAVKTTRVRVHASSEQGRCLDCAPGDPMPSRYCSLHQLHWLPVQQRIAYKLAVLTSDVQTSEHVEPDLPSRPNHGTCLKPNFMLICHPAADPTVHRGQTFLSVLKSRPKTFHSLRLSVNTAPTCLQTPKPLKLRPYDTCRINSIITLHLRRSVL